MTFIEISFVAIKLYQICGLLANNQRDRSRNLFYFFSKKPFEFTLGEGQVITGWDLGLLDMCVGEVRQLVVPSHVGYGEWAPGDKVPPKSTIEFFVELLQIKNTFSDKEMVSDTFSQIDTNGDSMLSNDEVDSHIFFEFENGNCTSLHRIRQFCFLKTF